MTFVIQKRVLFAIIVNNIYAKFVINLFMKKKKNSNHTKQALDPYVPILLKCPEHPEVPLNLFCLDEKGIYIILIIYIFNINY